MADRLCSVVDCGKPRHYANPPVCPKHYQRWKASGSFDLVKKAPKPRPRRVGVEPCQIDGCEKVISARGWCTAHWTRWKRHGSPTARLRGEVVDGKRVCSTCELDKPLSEFGRVTDSWCRLCANAYQLAYKTARYVPKPKWQAICGHCGTDFMANKRRSIFCSRECFEVGRHRRAGKYVQARRARTVEPFFPSEVYERDGWTCGLCQEPIDRLAVKPHPMSPSIDHVIPISKGGEHSLRNVQAAHLGCNVKKGNRVEAAA